MLIAVIVIFLRLEIIVKTASSSSMSKWPSNEPPICHRMKQKFVKCIELQSYKPRKCKYYGVIPASPFPPRLKAMKNCMRLDNQLKKKCDCVNFERADMGDPWLEVVERENEGRRRIEEAATCSKRCAQAGQCQYGNGADYRGNVSVTISGKKCQKWSRQWPHEHTITPERYSKQGIGNHNYCRNPLGNSNTEGPWCFTIGDTNKNITWEHCSVPKCDFNIKKKYNALPLTAINPNLSYTCQLQNHKIDSYRGTVNTTKSGRTCMNWGTPGAQYFYNPEDHGYLGIRDHNHCRNPSKDKGGVWCYVEDAEIHWENCDVRICTESAGQCLTDFGSNYRGPVNVTVSGIPCSEWPESELEETSYSSNNGIGKHNECRNPAGQRMGVWCYVDTNNIDLQFSQPCPVPDCEIKDLYVDSNKICECLESP